MLGEERRRITFGDVCVWPDHFILFDTSANNAARHVQAHPT